MDVELCNAALACLGLGPMADPNLPRGKAEAAIAANCLRVRRAVLEAQMWTACDTTAVVAASTDWPVPPGFEKVGPLPKEFLGLWRCDLTDYAVCAIEVDAEPRRAIAWRGGETLTIRYSRDIPFGLMNPLLQQSAAASLAVFGAIAQSEKPSDRKIHTDIAIAVEVKTAARDAFNRQEGSLFEDQSYPYQRGGMSYNDNPGGRW